MNLNMRILNGQVYSLVLLQDFRTQVSSEIAALKKKDDTISGLILAL